MTDFRKGQFAEHIPIFFNVDGLPLHVIGMYKGCSGFLVSNGPSLKTIDLKALQQPGIVTIGVNNGPSVFRPNLHVCGDQPGRFIKSIWLDPKIQKVVPLSSFGSQLWDNESWEVLTRDGKPLLVKECPNVVGIHRNDHFEPEQWLYEPTFGWGNSGKNGGCRTVFLLAIKVMFVLGIRKLFIVGADMKMLAGEDTGYAFAQVRCSGATRMNNNAYRKINKRCAMLKPYFDREGFRVYNATKDSGLTAFPYMPLEDALRVATAGFSAANARCHDRTEDSYLTLDHPAKLGLPPDAVARLDDKGKKNYARRDKEWFERMVAYKKDGKTHLIPKSFLAKHKDFLK